MNDMTERLDRIEQRVDVLGTEVAELRLEVGELRDEVGELRGEVGELRGEVREFRREVVTPLLELRDFVQRVADGHERRIQALESDRKPPSTTQAADSQ